MLKFKEKDKATFFSPTDEWSLQAASTIKPKEREFVVDSGASMHMLSRKDLNSVEVETVRFTRRPTTVMTANGEVQTKEETTIKELDLFVTVMLTEDTRAVVSHRQLIKAGRHSKRNTSNYVPIVVPGLSTGSSGSAARTSPTSLLQEAVALTQHPAATRSESTSSNERVRRDP